MFKYKIIIGSTLFLTISSYAWADAPIYEVYGSFGGIRADAASVSADGKTIGVRRISSSGTYDKSFIVTPDGTVDIGSFDDSGLSALLAISANGLAAIGISSVNSTDTHAFWWSAETGIHDIGTVGGTYT